MMHLSEEDVAALRETWMDAVDDAEAIVADFYARLFAAAPETRALFRPDMAVQRRKLIETLATAVDAADAPEDIHATLHALGRRHAGYGVRPAHFAVMTDVVLATLADHVGPRFDGRARGAWRRCLEMVRRGMTEHRGGD